ncbi:hypothetical protein A1O3_05329 [Capronia epimyces CBS 606.96]|uniref:Uncharacterized protein n=1 Tax=Capronia epimyces CBS 606.96 TaxID=1182542 RepID=W9YQW4_9EURO|nr:uncharacterized protein A1O3_05329 [Capronia epimyces CBS 606.96]EXJ84659.1 hypothetical protein A1O3_05329 [Capronia epimyces CBS 606.96]
MSTRRTLSDQPRNWSQESSSSQEELIAYRGNRNVKEAVRCPKGPPPDDRVEDEGFARFLKKHASPTHQRVTAGGRIVPMEHRPRPPVCHLVNCNENPEPEGKNNAPEGSARNTQGPKLEIASPIQPKPEPQDILQRQSHQIPVPNAIIDNTALAAGVNVNLVPTGDALAIDTAAAQSQWVAPILSAPVGPSMFPDPYYLQSPPLFPGCAMPLTPPLPGYNGSLDGQFAMSLPVSPDMMMGLSALSEMSMAMGEFAATDATYFDHMIACANARFEEADRQLKTINRHRAINNRDPYVTEHRMAVAVLRANAKAEVSYWTNLASEAKAAKMSVGTPSRTLNVEAAAYVPLQSNSLVPASSSKSSTLSKGSDSTVQPTKPKPSLKAGRRGIPIVPPPETLDLPVKELRDTGLAHPPPSVAVDEWGVRIGDAPPAILRHQEEMAKALIREASKSPQKSASEVSIQSPVASYNTSPLHNQAVEATLDENSENKSQNGEWLPTKPGRAPATVEACYELQLDAMRLPKGIISKVRLPDGTITEVRGQGLKRPPSLGMDDFERRYWRSKPVLTKEMASRFIEVRSCGEGPAADNVLDHLDFNRFNVERLVLVQIAHQMVC